MYIEQNCDIQSYKYIGWCTQCTARAHFKCHDVTSGVIDAIWHEAMCLCVCVCLIVFASRQSRNNRNKYRELARRAVIIIACHARELQVCVKGRGGEECVSRASCILVAAAHTWYECLSVCWLMRYSNVEHGRDSRFSNRGNVRQVSGERINTATTTKTSSTRSRLAHFMHKVRRTACATHACLTTYDGISNYIAPPPSLKRSNQ